MKILYIMHVPWGWIKQRPHFLAEYLNRDFNIDIRYKRPWKVKKKNLLNHLSNGISPKVFVLFPFDKFPFIGNISYVHQLNALFFRLQLGNLKKYSYVWITSLSLYAEIRSVLKQVRVVYDCMDDELEFPAVANNPKRKEKLRQVEKQLVAQAEMIFCSSQYLKNKLIQRTGTQREIVLLNNAVELPAEKEPVSVPSFIVEIEKKYFTDKFVFMYVGTVSAWFDFNLVVSMLDRLPSASVVLVGPHDVAIPDHERLIDVGAIDRKYLFYLMSKCSVLLMPFQINELIRSVNPVKLYEYIYAHKPILVPDYEEIEQFKSYLYSYSNPQEFYELCEKAVSGELKIPQSESENKAFADKNVWAERYQVVKNKLLEG